MKHLRFALTVVVLALTSVAFAQHDAQKPSADAVPTAAQKSFTTIKTLAGEWEGPVTVPEMPEMSGGKPMHISLRVTSRGNVLVHEMQEAGTPLGCDQVRSSGDDALRGRRPAHPGSLL